jgi:hypothetical protein
MNRIVMVITVLLAMSTLQSCLPIVAGAAAGGGYYAGKEGYYVGKSK